MKCYPHLVSLETKGENTQLLQIMSSMGVTNAWTSGADFGSESKVRATGAAHCCRRRRPCLLWSALVRLTHYVCLCLAPQFMWSAGPSAGVVFYKDRAFCNNLYGRRRKEPDRAQWPADPASAGAALPSATRL